MKRPLQIKYLVLRAVTSGCKKPGLKCWLTERVAVDKTKLYSNQLKQDLLYIVSAGHIKLELVNPWPPASHLNEMLEVYSSKYLSTGLLSFIGY